MISKLFSPHKSFLSLGILWIIVFTHVFFAGLIGTIIYNSSILYFDPTYEGFNKFVEIFKVPLAILALIIPIVALLAANHRSEQTKEQMRIAHEQNLFSNYYKHIEEFEKYCEKININVLKLTSTRHIHGTLFRSANTGDYTISLLAIHNVELFIMKFVDAAKGLQSNDPKEWKPAVILMHLITHKICEKFSIKINPPSKGNELKHEESSAVIHDGDVKNLVIIMLRVVQLMDALFRFDTSYETPETLTKILSYDYTSLPTSKIDNIRDFVPIYFKPDL